jgi:bifunctional N-acetylglucosamine-1-phosphate-uridyltransferase/glucosamine-1-phosphate-acetyltransferase GlmU-like protein
MTAYLLLSAGIGRSMKTKGAKSLLEYDGISVLQHQIRTIRSSDDKADICIVVGFQCNKVVKAALQESVRIVYNHKYESTGQSESIKIGLNSTNKTDIFVIHGDVVFNSAAIKKTKISHVVLENSTDKRKVGLCHNSLSLVGMSYGIDNKWGQIAYFNSKDFSTLKDLANTCKSNMSTYELINEMITKTKIVVRQSDDIKIVEIEKNYESPDY